MQSNLRKWLGIVITIICYYVIHEGAHLLVAVALGVFREIRFMGIGMQIVIEASSISDIQLAFFNIIGSVASIIVGYILVLSKHSILITNNKLLKAACYYTTIGLLIIDPLYLSTLCGFFGGGDMNGIIMFGVPEIGVRLVYTIILAINVLVCIKYVYPTYKKSFAKI